MNQLFAKGTPNKDRKLRKAKRVSKKVSVKEITIQKQSEELLNRLNIKFIHIPDALLKMAFSANSKMPIHIKVIVSRLVKGIPDLVILLPNGKYICIELKTEKGTLSTGQKEFKNAIGINNFYLCRSVDEVIGVLKKYDAVV